MKTKEAQEWKYFLSNFAVPVALVGGGLWFAIEGYFDYPIPNMELFYISVATIIIGILWIIAAGARTVGRPPRFDGPSVKDVKYQQPKEAVFVKIFGIILIVGYYFFIKPRSGSVYSWIFIVAMGGLLIWMYKMRKPIVQT